MLAERIMASYARALASVMGPGEALSLQRGFGADATSFPVQGWVTGYDAQEMAGEVQQGRRKAIILASSVTDSGFPLPIVAQQDRIGFAGKTLAIVSVDEATRRVQGELIAYEIELAGA